ncbi:hypothetical protein [Silvimonas amylolytica]|nr:hypothetical protein [Silvimonas amylolytica]
MNKKSLTGFYLFAALFMVFSLPGPDITLRVPPLISLLLFLTFFLIPANTLIFIIKKSAREHTGALAILFGRDIVQFLLRFLTLCLVALFGVAFYAVISTGHAVHPANTDYRLFDLLRMSVFAVAMCGALIYQLFFWKTPAAQQVG